MILIRIAVGLTMSFPEGLQKLLSREILGTKISAFPGRSSSAVRRHCETVCGLLIVLGLGTRLAAIPLIMIVALLSIKLPILLGHD